MVFERDGFCHFPGALDEDALTLLDGIACAAGGPGIRLGANKLGPVAELLGSGGAIGSIVDRLNDRQSFPVRGILFDKSIGQLVAGMASGSDDLR